MNPTVLAHVEYLSDWMGNILHGNREVEEAFIDEFFGKGAGDRAEIISFKFNSEKLEFVVLVDSGASVIQSVPLRDAIEFIEAQYSNHKMGFGIEPHLELGCLSQEWFEYPLAYPKNKGETFPWCVNQDGDPCFYDTDTRKWHLAGWQTKESIDVKYWKFLRKKI